MSIWKWVGKNAADVARMNEDAEIEEISQIQEKLTLKGLRHLIDSKSVDFKMR